MATAATRQGTRRRRGRESTSDERTRMTPACIGVQVNGRAVTRKMVVLNGLDVRHRDRPVDQPASVIALNGRAVVVAAARRELADELLDDLVDADGALHAAELIEHDGHVLVRLLERFERAVHWTHS